MLAQTIIEFKIRPMRIVVMAALASAYPLAGYAAGAARIDFATADVKAVAADGRSRPLARGTEVVSGETIDTGNGRAQLRFSDGAQMALAPQTQFRIDEYRFNGKADGSERGFFSLVKGAMRTITGLVGRSNHDHYKVTTSVATIGIRGTEYSVAYQQGGSIDTTTGEGSTLVCNAAGCLILDSGETAFVADQNTKPAMTEQHTEIAPPPAQEGQLPGFVAGNNTNSEGAPTALLDESGQLPTLAKLVSGPGYSLATIGVFGGSSEMNLLPGDLMTTQATISNGGLAAFTADDGDGVLYSYAQGAPVAMLTDGILGWGRWIDGAYQVDSEVTINKAMQHVHYVVGVPTPLADMNALQLANTTATYSLSGFTYPTAWDGSTFTLGTQPITGSLTANFGSQSVSGNLTVPMGANVYSTSWSGMAPNISGSTFSGYGSAFSTGSDCGGCGCTSYVNGFFAGANAARAGLVYEIGGSSTYGSIHGAAAFKKD